MLPTNNIATTGNYPDAIFMQSTCDCSDPEHQHKLIVELNEYDDITCSIYQTLEWAQYRHYTNEPGFVSRAFTRIKNAFKYLLTGCVAVEGHHLFREEAARDYANAILEALNELNRRKMSAMQTTTWRN